MDFHLQHRLQKHASSPHKICCFLLCVQEQRWAKWKWAQHRHVTAFTLFKCSCMSTDNNIPGLEKNGTCRKANIDTVIIWFFFLIAEFTTVVFFSGWIFDNHFAASLKCENHSFMVYKLQQVKKKKKILCYLTGKQVF